MARQQYTTAARTRDHTGKFLTEPTLPDIFCVICGKTFRPIGGRKRCCSRLCRLQDRAKALLLDESNRIITPAMLSDMVVIQKMTSRAIAAALSSSIGSVARWRQQYGRTRARPALQEKDPSSGQFLPYDPANPERSLHADGSIYLKRPGHPHAITQGWGKEHLILMADLLERPLTDEECVHHKDENTQNNDPSNLQLMSKDGHNRLHRHKPGNRQLHEDNPLSLCRCGCGETLSKYDKRGRPRQTIYGHSVLWGKQQNG